ncbi:zf-HC2 domain-containing protein [Aeoliella mucimassa]|uniref:Uncharacterized protein n=1 Tax=Aeoliella mucimassa TaxID=2527972 RepID=A0A518AKY2_9BACT|nr:zf-HC2 domain-containing protein [Aeoliella mucimassa]QDU55387.1 hypothetical protein Pan181_15760 [Aeoliella mucimassa]
MSHETRQDEWHPCSSGELSKLTARLERQYRREQVGAFMPVITAAALLIAVVGLGMFWTSDPPVARITCTECHDHFTAYHDHLLGTTPMADPEAHSMQAHLEHCQRCREAFEQQFPGLLADGLHQSGEWLARRDVQLPLAVSLRL